MTNHWIDIKNSNVVIIMGGNAAEAHPVGFGWVTEAMQHNNAKLIVVDPRFNRSAALADHYAPIRSGTDIAFLLGVIRYLISTNQINFDYVKAYTNASYLVREDFEFHEGLFSGFDEEKGDYDKESWFYQLDENGYAKVDESLEHPRCVWNLLKQHVERYDFATVSNITGTPADDYQVVCEAIGSTYTKDRAATFMYALGWTHHSKGAQNIRTMAMVQLLLGNIGQLGGGVNALRGHANVQGSTDMGLLCQSLPGYLKLPNDKDVNLQTYLGHYTPKPLRPGQTNYWQNYPKFFISQMKGFWGEHATAENDFGYDWLPKWDQMYDFGRYLDMMYRGQINGCIVQGVNAINSMPNRNKNLKALSKLKYLIVLDNLASETATFWQNEPDYNEVDTASIQTEVFRLPTTCFAEEEGSIVNSGRWMQWHYKGANAPGESMPDSEIVAGILLEMKKLYREEGGKLPEPVEAVKWDYADPHNPSSVELTKELNGYDVNTGRQLSSFSELKDDGSTACACWIYAGSWTEQGNQMARRDNHDPSGKGITPGWAFAWPANRRVLYNRASCDVNGKPWDPNRTIVEWKDGKWEGIDVPDFNAKLNPQDSAHPFIMQAEGVGRLFALKLLKEGPFPEHYEPVESPIGTNPLHPKVVHSPVLRWFEGVKETIGTKEEFPYACTTYSLTEHFNFWTTHCRLAAISMPETFVEMNEQLAAEKGIKNGDLVKVSSKRGHIFTKALVTKRLQPLQVNGQTVHTLGIPRHGSHNALTKKAYTCNVLTTEMGDANTGVPEYKAFLVNVEKAEV
ncbi:formate dehydrogenase (quinone-dependent) catalytic subunit [Shewanella chilikensis]|uniref:Formate dehydrogenase (Quinone-dependent) catalytic subunit n=2 Tax=Shewanella chilikensis TaxID=558541 RepID=A0ABX5PPL2_9GAMM|nr:formate dehydrogenase (quinone-dependent) catalytic subunit [Shewanella chilikensis]